MQDYLSGILSFSWLPLITCLLVFGHFVYSYKNYCLKEGFKVDYWHVQVALYYILPYFIFYPFAGSYLNFFATGEAIDYIRDYVNKAFWITFIGYVFTYLGFYANRVSAEETILVFRKINNLGAKYLNVIGKNKFILLLLAIILSIISLGLVSFMIKEFGLNFNIRGNALSSSSIRPVYNFWITISGIVTIIIILRIMMFKETFFIVAILFIVAFTLFSGARHVIIAPVLSATIYYLINRRLNVNLWWIFLFGLVGIIVIIYLGALRDNRTNDFSQSFGLSIFYGNSFSDLRDFAWVLAYWDHHLLLGKTYLAALMSFVPRSLSEFRETYAVGVYIDNILGFDPEIHPGLRTGKFGEIYFNFGIIGVILLGFISGYILKFTNDEIKKIALEKKSDYIKMHSKTFLTSVVDNFHITAGFWGVYVNIIVLFFVYLLNKIRIKK